MLFLMTSQAGALAAWWLCCVSVAYGASLLTPAAKK
jgi:hypothetical protein